MLRLRKYQILHYFEKINPKKSLQHKTKYHISDRLMEGENQNNKTVIHRRTTHHKYQVESK